MYFQYLVCATYGVVDNDSVVSIHLCQDGRLQRSGNESLSRTRQ